MLRESSIAEIPSFSEDGELRMSLLELERVKHSNILDSMKKSLHPDDRVIVENPSDEEGEENFVSFSSKKDENDL